MDSLLVNGKVLDGVSTSGLRERVAGARLNVGGCGTVASPGKDAVRLIPLYPVSLISTMLMSSPTRAQDAPRPAAPQPSAPVPAGPRVGAGSIITELTSETTLAGQIDEVDQRARLVERRLAELEAQAATARAATPVLAASDRGFNWKSADGAFLIKIRGLIHADGRQHLGDEDLAVRDSFLIGKARPLLEATFFDLADFRLMPDFAGGTATIQDAYIDVRPWSWLKLRGGKFKAPVGLERLQNDPAVVFPERGLPTALAPNRDLGFMLHGVFGPGVFSYELGIFNGVVDGGSGDADNNRAKDLAVRLFVQPWKANPNSFLANFGLGVAGTTGSQHGTAAVFQTMGMTTRRTASSAPGLPAFRTAGVETFFSYRINDEVADSTAIGQGWRTRLSPQGYFYQGSFGLLGEYIRSTQAVELGPASGNLTHQAWQVAAYYVLGGKPLYEGTTVTTPFDPRKGTWGALELGARYNVLSLDDDAFGTFADPARAAARAQAIGAVANWHWSRNIKLSLAFERTDFEGGAAGGDRKPENSLFQRIQATF